MNYTHNPVFLIGHYTKGKKFSREELIRRHITGFKEESGFFRKLQFSSLAHYLFNRIFFYGNEDAAEDETFELSFLEFVEYLKEYKKYSGNEPYHHNPSTFSVYNKDEESRTVDDFIRQFIDWEINHGRYELNEDTFSSVVHELFNLMFSFHTDEEAARVGSEMYENAGVWRIEFLDVVRHLREYMEERSTIA